MRKGRFIAAAVFALGFAGAPALAQTGQHGRAMVHGPGPGAVPALPGQDLFGAITEIVDILNADPETDWRVVDIDALRAHLLDMQRVATHAHPRAETVAGGMSFTLDRSGAAGAAAERMLAAHGPVLESELGWRADLSFEVGEIRWIVRAPGDSAGAVRIRALGFFGLLASGAHHQAHHLAMARGAGHAHMTGD